MSLRHAMLGLLAERPRTGYELWKEFEGSLAHAWPASHSQIYPELARLAADGLILQTASGARGSKTYELTEAGLRDVRHWLVAVEPSRPVRNDALLRVLLLWLLEPDEAMGLLERELRVQRATLIGLEEAVASLPLDELPAAAGARARANRIALDYGIATTRARVAWAESAIAGLTAETSSA